MNTPEQLTLRDVINEIDTRFDARINARLGVAVQEINAHTDSVIDELALSVGKQFNAIDEQFKEIRGDIREMKTDIAGIHIELKRVDSRLTSIETRHGSYFRGMKTALATA